MNRLKQLSISRLLIYQMLVYYRTLHEVAKKSRIKMDRLRDIIKDDEVTRSELIRISCAWFTMFCCKHIKQ